ncbi:hypothetical protein BDZ91DRAFT_791272 [Kalaharituber pfeilii]|nr:hypothetical protein BDZ91DRAFT_791272 [Kalaharituber pfeilii]
MEDCEARLDVFSAEFLPLAVPDPTPIIPTAITLDSTEQQTSLIVLPPGVDLLGIICRRTMSAGTKTISDSLLHWHDVHLGSTRNALYFTPHTCIPNLNQLPTPLCHNPEHATNITSNTIHHSVLNEMFSAVPAPYNNYPQIVHDYDPMAEGAMDENQGSDLQNIGMHLDRQDAPSLLNVAISQLKERQVIFWMPPQVPHDFVAAPMLPGYDIKFEEPAIFADPAVLR